MTAISPWSPQPVAKAITLQSKPQHYLSEGTPMSGNYSARLTGSKRNLLALLASSVVFSAGCSNMSSTAPVVNSLSTAATRSSVLPSLFGSLVRVLRVQPQSRLPLRPPTAAVPLASPRTPSVAMMVPLPPGPAPRVVPPWFTFSLREAIHRTTAWPHRTILPRPSSHSMAIAPASAAPVSSI